MVIIRNIQHAPIQDRGNIVTNYIKVENPNNHVVWEKNLTRDEAQNVRAYCEGRDYIQLYLATLYPVRTGNLKNFSEDFFLPTVINHARKVQDTVDKIFAILGALILEPVFILEMS